MDLPKRKQIRLPQYDYSGAGAYFVTICTHQKKHLFLNGVGAHLCVRPNRPDLLVEKWLHELEQKYPGVELDYFVVMPNHVHFILFITGAHTGAPLPEIVKWFKTQTTNAYIAGVRSGEFPPFDRHVWQRNYYEHVIRNEQDLFSARNYIQGNPLKWREDENFSME